MTTAQRIEKHQSKVDRTRDFQRQARAMRDQGMSISAIAQRFGMSESSVRLLLQYPS